MIRVVFAGLLATIVMTAMMYFVRPIIVGEPMDIAAKIGGQVGGSWALGMTIHFFIGVIFMPVIYAFVFFRFLPGPAAVKGVLFGTIFWLVNMTVAMPMMGEGMFLSAAGGGPKPLVAAFMVHAIYGALLGQIGGSMPGISNCKMDAN